MRKEREEKCRDQASLKVLAARLSTAKAPGSAALVVAGLGGTRTCDGSVGEDLMEVLQAHVVLAAHVDEQSHLCRAPEVSATARFLAIATHFDEESNS